MTKSRTLTTIPTTKLDYVYGADSQIVGRGGTGRGRRGASVVYFTHVYQNNETEAYETGTTLLIVTVLSNPAWQWSCHPPLRLAVQQKPFRPLTISSVIRGTVRGDIESELEENKNNG